MGTTISGIMGIGMAGTGIRAIGPGTLPRSLWLSHIEPSDERRRGERLRLQRRVATVPLRISAITPQLDPERILGRGHVIW
jgi:hypothetical protein